MKEIENNTPTIHSNWMTSSSRCRKPIWERVNSTSSTKTETPTREKCKKARRVAGATIITNQVKSTQAASSMMRSMAMAAITFYQGLSTKETGAVA